MGKPAKKIEQTKIDEFIIKMENDMCKFSRGRPKGGCIGSEESLIWNLFISKEYIQQLTGGEVITIIKTLINRREKVAIIKYKNNGK